jgi:hypothetical protein
MSKTSVSLVIIIGVILAYTSRFLPLILGLAVLILGIGFVLFGCYHWTKIKNRYWAYMFWGLLAPIRLLGISLLKDKSTPISEREESLKDMPTNGT